MRFRLAASVAFVLCLLVVCDRPPSLQGDPEWSPRLVLNVVDELSGEPLAARFSLSVDGTPHEPRWVGPHGLRFASVHASKRQAAIVTYTRGTGPVWVPLKPGARTVRVVAAKGLNYLPASGEAEVESESVQITLGLRRWNRLREKGWHAADAHLHYDRLEPSADRDWFAMMAGDDLDQTHFLVLKGGMVPGVWARQFGYGKAGQGESGGRTIVAGQEYRDRLQGHLLLFGLEKVIPPIMTGVPGSPYNYPTFPDVLHRARASGALTGAAHGGTLGSSPTVLLDAILGKLDFIEIANWVTGFWPLENWYRLLNSGYVLPPTAGTDLPNNPQRAAWQPFLGGMRMYAKTNGEAGADAWSAAIKRGETFVTNGPSIELEVNDAGPGGTVCLPAGGGEVMARVRMHSPHELRVAELVRHGRVVASSTSVKRDGDMYSLELETAVQITDSTWIAARGEGSAETIEGGSEVAHTAAVRIFAGREPIRSPSGADELLSGLAGQRTFYRSKGTYASAEHRGEMLQLFDLAIASLIDRRRLEGESCLDSARGEDLAFSEATHIDAYR